MKFPGHVPWMASSPRMVQRPLSYNRWLSAKGTLETLVSVREIEFSVELICRELN